MTDIQNQLPQRFMFTNNITVLLELPYFPFIATHGHFIFARLKQGLI